MNLRAVSTLAQPGIREFGSECGLEAEELVCELCHLDFAVNPRFFHFDGELIARFLGAFRAQRGRDQVFIQRFAEGILN